MAGQKTSRKKRIKIKKKSQDPLKLIKREELDLKRRLLKQVSRIRVDIKREGEDYRYRFIYPTEFVEFCMGIAAQTMETIQQNQALAQARKLKEVTSNSE